MQCNNCDETKACSDRLEVPAGPIPMGLRVYKSGPMLHVTMNTPQWERECLLDESDQKAQLRESDATARWVENLRAAAAELLSPRLPLCSHARGCSARPLSWSHRLLVFLKVFKDRLLELQSSSQLKSTWTALHHKAQQKVDESQTASAKRMSSTVC